MPESVSFNPSSASLASATPVTPIEAISTDHASQGSVASPAPADPAPLKVDVVRGDDGIFVYTLTDPGTGAVLAVIPREAVRTGRDGRNLDQKV